MTDKLCEQCNRPVGITEVFGTDDDGQTWAVKWKGWICGYCGYLDPAVGREVKMAVETKGERRGQE